MVAENGDVPLGARDGDIHATSVGEETHASASVAANHGDDDALGFSALESIN